MRYMRVQLTNKAACDPERMGVVRREVRGVCERAGCDPSSMRVVAFEPDCSLPGYVFSLSVEEGSQPIT